MKDDFFYNEQGAKVYTDPEKLPCLDLPEGQTRYNVLSVGVMKPGIPTATIETEEGPVCYRLPQSYYDWATTCIALAVQINRSMFPSKCIFTHLKSRYYVDIL